MLPLDLTALLIVEASQCLGLSAIFALNIYFALFEVTSVYSIYMQLSVN